MNLSQSSRALCGGVIWVVIGLSLAVRGTFPFGTRALEASVGLGLLALVLGLLVGGAKGWFVLRRSASRMISRIESRPAPEPFWQIYPPRLALLIPLMIGFGWTLKYLCAESQPGVIFGVYVGIGAALVTSSPPFFAAAGRFRANGN